MLRFALSILLLPLLAMASDDVAFKNNAPAEVKCELQVNGKFVPFVRLQPGESKAFNNFKVGSGARCYTAIVNGYSTTMYTYFTVESKGMYEVLRERVKCKTCTGSATREATIIVPPNGQAMYNDTM